tara:strand:- start:268 stop:489 length:222 start_codon:yes stop_codon:yes gene_type:complete
MSIIITNISKKGKKGMNSYELVASGELIAEFRHYRFNGLYKCLLKAAAAVKKAENKKRDNMIKKLIGRGADPN